MGLTGRTSSAFQRGVRLGTIPTRVGRTDLSKWIPPCRSDHAHARGENSVRIQGGRLRDGPSPRAWGEHELVSLYCVAIRTIPTRVGRTEAPNICGDWCFGPSPRAWGEQHAHTVGLDSLRTIPTRVGRTRMICCALNGRSDHPHARGENAITGARFGSSSGPSPRAWGELNLAHRV